MDNFSETPTYVVLLAGGSGQRMGDGRPKQFRPLGGRPILLRTVERFEEALDRPQFIIVLPKAHRQLWMDLCFQAGRPDLKCLLCDGGLTRFHSVQNALAHVPPLVRVAIHDSVRPLVSPSLIRTAFDAAALHPAVVPALPIVDSLRWIGAPAESCSLAPAGRSGSAASHIVSRDNLYAIQTPQVFRSQDLKAAYTQAYRPTFTDDASVAEAWGLPLHFIPGDPINLKITRPADLVLAERLV